METNDKIKTSIEIETNIKINYMIFEQILRLTGTYRNICEDYEYEFLDYIFEQAKNGNFDSLFEDDATKELALGKIEYLTGVAKKYWAGEERIKLGIDVQDIQDEEIEIEIDPERTINTIKEIEGVEEYKDIMRNPLNLNFEDIYILTFKLHKKEEYIDFSKIDTEVLEDLYSLKSLLKILLINMEDTGIVALIDKDNVYRHSKWEPYMRTSEKPTKQGIIYSPKYITFRKGNIQTIIKNILDLGFIFTLRDYETAEDRQKDKDRSAIKREKDKEKAKKKREEEREKKRVKQETEKAERKVKKAKLEAENEEYEAKHRKMKEAEKRQN